VGVAQQRTEQDNNVARVIALLSDLGESVPATSINRWCASSMQAIISAADAIAAGNRDCIIAGGVENMSRVPMDGDSYEHLHPELSEQYNVFQLQMGMTAEKVAEEYEVSREAQDEYAARSHQRAAEATESGRFDDEIVPVETDDGLIDEDEGIRPTRPPRSSPASRRRSRGRHGDRGELLADLGRRVADARHEQGVRRRPRARRARGGRHEQRRRRRPHRDGDRPGARDARPA